MDQYQSLRPTVIHIPGIQNRRWSPKQLGCHMLNFCRSAQHHLHHLTCFFCQLGSHVTLCGPTSESTTFGNRISSSINCDVKLPKLCSSSIGRTCCLCYSRCMHSADGGNETMVPNSDTIANKLTCSTVIDESLQDIVHDKLH